MRGKINIQGLIVQNMLGVVFLVILGVLAYFVYRPFFRHAPAPSEQGTPIDSAARFYEAYRASIENGPGRYDQPGLVTATFVRDQKALRSNPQLNADPVLCAQDDIPQPTFSEERTTATSSLVRGAWHAEYSGGAETHQMDVSLVQQDGKWLVDAITCK